MVLQFKSNRSNSGFVLLQALWLTLLTSLLASTMLEASLGAAKDSEAAIAAFRTEMAAESAIHTALYQLLVSGIAPSFQRRAMQIDGHEVLVTTQDVSGLLDLNACDEAALHRLLASLNIGDGRPAVSAILAARPLTSYAALAAIHGVSQHHIDRLMPHVTLFSRQAAPNASIASQWLATTLGLKLAAPSVLTGASSPAGRVVRITAVAKTRTASSRRLVVEYLVTGRRDQPYWVYEWVALPVNNIVK
ncbi:hypothetical protein [Rugamonas sp. DEMB1]|jgi:hypothetical protein|uniref:hypothetical protein n=1 Tax=Rugamonas sp. DEMB1 TaxID=3039386 RepID=UPI002449B79B|nr:hypothetical protein [Rugamonas sp. DEMB1]WGG52879.1 hypothetical protein QC826_12480 [Rugamonas sp. DEMB1]